MILSSRQYYAAYHAARPKILHSVFNTQHGGLIDIADALTAVRSKGLWFKFHREEAISVLDTWRRRRAEKIRELRKPTIISPEETIKLFHLYRVWHFFLEDYGKNNTIPRPGWVQATRWNLPLLDLSDTEKRRILRGLCRLHIYCNIFGRIERKIRCLGDAADKDTYNDWDDDFEREDLGLFWDTMAPWECEELACVWSYLVAKYAVVSAKICTDLRNLAFLSECLFLRDVTPVEERPASYLILDVYDLDKLDRCPEGLTLIGPELLYRVLNAEDYLLQRNLVMANADPIYLWSSILYSASDWNGLYRDEPEDQYNVPDFERVWSTLPSFEQPNIGWKMACLVPHTPEQTLWDSFNRGRKRDQGWGWGYAIWDEKRLEGWRDDWAAFIDRE